MPDVPSDRDSHAGNNLQARLAELEATLEQTREESEQHRIEAAELTTIITATEHRLNSLEKEGEAKERSLRATH